MGARATLNATCACAGVRHTVSETWAATSMRTPVETRVPEGHEVSNPSVTVARWSAERMGPRSIAAPQRGQARLVSGTAAVIATGSGGAGADDGAASNRRARAMLAVRQRVARNPE
jgi:hypothetical protein